MAEQTFSVDLQGDKELMAAFDSLLRNIQRRIARKALREGARPALRRAKSLVPKKTRALKRSFKLRAIKRTRTAVGVVVRTGSRAELGIKDDEKAFYPASVEYGFETKDGTEVPAQSYIRRAFEETKNEANAKIAAIVGQEVESHWRNPNSRI